jgi:hypothetical protein
MVKPDRHPVWKRVSVQLNPLIGAAVIRVLHDVAGRLIYRQLEPGDFILVEKSPGKRAAEIADECAGSPEICQIAANLPFRSRKRLPYVADLDRDACQIVGRTIAPRKRHGGVADGIHKRVRIEFAVHPDAFAEAV